MTTTDLGQGRKVLVVEADDLMRELVCLWLAEAGYAAECHASLEQDLIARPDVIILNVPRSTSMWASLELLERRYRAPVIATSARFRRGLGSSSTAAKRLGVHSVLPKPFTREELLAAVAQTFSPDPGPR